MFWGLCGVVTLHVLAIVMGYNHTCLWPGAGEFSSTGPDKKSSGNFFNWFLVVPARSVADVLRRCSRFEREQDRFSRSSRLLFIRIIGACYPCGFLRGRRRFRSQLQDYFTFTTCTK